MRLITPTATTLVGLFVLCASPSLAQDASVPSWYPTQLTHLGEAQQVIVVTAPKWSSTHGILRAFELNPAGNWSEVLNATPAILGYSGLIRAKDRRQGSGKTPTGTFAITAAFGRLGNPETALPYTQVDLNDAWTYNPSHPATYNLFQTVDLTWSGYRGYVEKLWGFGEQYDYVAVLDYNLPIGPVTTGADGIRRSPGPPSLTAGGGIFLHVSNGNLTSGCISIEEARMKKLLTWLDPIHQPVIVIGTEATIATM